MMRQMTFDRLAVFDDLITNTASRPQGHADGNGRGNRGDLFHFRVVMMSFVMVPFMNPHVMHTMMTMCASQRCRGKTHEH